MAGQDALYLTQIEEKFNQDAEWLKKAKAKILEGPPEPPNPRVYFLKVIDMLIDLILNLGYVRVVHVRLGDIVPDQKAVLLTKVLGAELTVKELLTGIYQAMLWWFQR